MLTPDVSIEKKEVLGALKRLAPIDKNLPRQLESHQVVFYNLGTHQLTFSGHEHSFALLFVVICGYLYMTTFTPQLRDLPSSLLATLPWLYIKQKKLVDDLTAVKTYALEQLKSSISKAFSRREEYYERLKGILVARGISCPTREDDFTKKCVAALSSPGADIGHLPGALLSWSNNANLRVLSSSGAVSYFHSAGSQTWNIVQTGDRCVTCFLVSDDDVKTFLNRNPKLMSTIISTRGCGYLKMPPLSQATPQPSRPLIQSTHPNTPAASLVLDAPVSATLLLKSLKTVSRVVKSLAYVLPHRARVSGVVMRAAGALNTLSDTLKASDTLPFVEIDLLAEPEKVDIEENCRTALSTLQTLHRIYDHQFSSNVLSVDATIAVADPNDPGSSPQDEIKFLAPLHGLYLSTLMQSLPALTFAAFSHHIKSIKGTDDLVRVRKAPQGLSYSTGMQALNDTLVPTVYSATNSFYSQMNSLIVTENTSEIVKSSIAYICNPIIFANNLIAEDKLILSLNPSAIQMESTIKCTTRPFLVRQVADRRVARRVSNIACSWIDHLRLLFCESPLNADIVGATPTGYTIPTQNQGGNASLVHNNDVYLWLRHARGMHALSMARERDSTNGVSVAYRAQITYPLISYAPVSVQTWLLFCIPLWTQLTELATNAHSPSTQINPTNLENTAHLSQLDWAAFAKFADEHHVVVPSLMLEAARCTLAWQRPCDPILFPVADLTPEE